MQISHFTACLKLWRRLWTRLHGYGVVAVAAALAMTAAIAADTAQLSIADGVVVKFGQGAGIRVHDRLQSGVDTLLTSRHDHSVMGEVEPQQAPRQAKAGDWLGVLAAPEVAAGDLALDGLAIRYAGGTDGLPRHMEGGAALVLGGASHVLQGLKLTFNTVGIRVVGTGSPGITRSRIIGNAVGLLAEQGATPAIGGSDISGNTELGIRNTSPASIVQARGNWWGHVSGPRDPVANPFGRGNGVSPGVDYGDYLVAEPGLDCSIAPTQGYATRLRNVELRLDCAQAVQFRLQESTLFDSAQWSDMDSHPMLTSHLLSSGAGDKMVHAQFRMAQGGISQFSLPRPIAYAPEGPQLQFVQPVAGAVLEQDAPVVLQASDAEGVQTVEILIDGQRLALLTQPPFQATWALATVPDGRYNLQAIATNLLGLSSTISIPVQVQKRAVQPPTLTASFAGVLLLPDATITQAGQLDVAAQSPRGIANVKATINGLQIFERSGDASSSFKDVADGIYNYRLQITAGNQGTGTIPVSVAVTQSGQGGLSFHATDLFTETLDAGGKPIPGVANVRIRLQNDAVLTYLRTLTTDAQGKAVLTDLPPGTYTYRASGPRHADRSGRIFVRPGVTTSERVHLQYQTISIDFSVTETTIKDEYQITLEATFQTQVPAPVVLLEPLSISLPELQVGEEFTGELTLTNYGLIQADKVVFTPPQSDEYYRYEFLADIPKTLAAKQRVVIPYRITAVKLHPRSMGFRQARSAEMGAVQSIVVNARNAGSCAAYAMWAMVELAWICANGEEESRSLSATFNRLVGGACGSTGIGGIGGTGGDVSNYTYNSDGLLTLLTRTSPQAGQPGLSRSITYRYDKAGRLAGYEQKDGSGKLISQADYSRDALGRISQEQLIYGDGADRVTATLAQSWDADGRKTSQGYPDSSAAAFSYDKGYLKEATQPGSTDKITWADYQWMLPTKVQYPGASRSIAYDGFYRIQGIQVQGASNANLLTLGYQYDVESSITRKTLQLGSDVNGSVDYTYDALDRLTQARPSTSLAGLGLPQEQYGYDAVHNRISSLHQPGEWQYASGNRLTQRGLGADLVRYDYTATGHIQSATRNGSVTTNIYDATDRRIAVEQDGQLIARYQYDPFGRRISKTLGAVQGGRPRGLSTARKGCWQS